MTAAYFEDHPTDPDKVILRKPYSTDCPNCEYHRQRAQRWREEAYRQAGHPLPEREWVGLTKEERHEISMANRPYCADVMAAHEEELKRRNYG